jgi:hypothetical protein
MHELIFWSNVKKAKVYQGGRGWEKLFLLPTLPKLNIVAITRTSLRFLMMLFQEQEQKVVTMRGCDDNDPRSGRSKSIRAAIHSTVLTVANYLWLLTLLAIYLHPVIVSL